MGYAFKRRWWISRNVVWRINGKVGRGLNRTRFQLPALQPPVEDRRGRRLYIGNLPGGRWQVCPITEPLSPGVSEQAIVQFFNGALLAAAGVDYSVASASGQFPVLRAEIGPRRPDAAGQVGQ